MPMRVLFTSPAAFGHILPMVPLARAVAERGHDVLWATPADGVDLVERNGVAAVATGPAGLARPAEILRRHPEIAALPPSEIPDALFGKLFGAHSTPPILAELTPIAREWRPDLVVADAADFAGHIVAAELGVPSVTKGFGAILPEHRMRSAGDEVAALWEERGLEPRPFGGAFEHLYLDVYPPELVLEPATHVPYRQLLRPVMVTSDTALDSAEPLPLPDPTSIAPLVYVTMGTVFNDPGPLGVVLDALSRLDLRVLVTVGPDGDPSALGPQPPLVRIERYVPQSAVLPHCAVVVSHGGSGTALATAALGLPQLCLPQGADQFLNAAAVASAGAGLSLSPAECTVEAVRHAVVRLLAEPSFSAAAGRISVSIASMPSPDEVAGVLESLP